MLPQKMIDNSEMRFERLRLVSQHNILLAAKCIIHCFLPQERERRFILGLAEELVKDYDNLEDSASAFVAISRLGDRGLLFEQYERLKKTSNKIKKNLIPHYLKFLKYNVAEQEQSILFSMLINLSTSYEEAVEIFHAMELQHILPTIYAYNGVINKTNDWEETQFWLIRAANEGLKPNIITYGILMRLSKDFNTAWELKQEMNRKGMKADSQIYELLLNKATHGTTKKDSIEILAQDSLNNKFYEKGFYEKIISRISGYDASFSFLEGLKRKKIFKKLNKEEIYNFLSNKIDDYAQLNSLLKELKNNNIIANDKIFKNLARNAKSYEDTIFLLDKMEELNINITKRVFGCFIDNLSNYEDIENILEKMKLYKIEIDNKIFQILLNKEKNYVQSIALLNKMEENGLQVDNETYNKIVRKIKKNEDFFKILKFIKNLDVTIYIETYNSLIVKSQDYKQAKDIFEYLKNDTVKLNIATYNNLIVKSEDYKQAKDIFQYLKNDTVKPNIETYNVLIMKSQEYEECYKIFESLKNEILLDFLRK